MNFQPYEKFLKPDPIDRHFYRLKIQKFESGFPLGKCPENFLKSFRIFQNFPVESHFPCRIFDQLEPVSILSERIRPKYLVRFLECFEHHDEKPDYFALRLANLHTLPGQHIRTGDRRYLTGSIKLFITRYLECSKKNDTFFKIMAFFVVFGQKI